MTSLHDSRTVVDSSIMIRATQTKHFGCWHTSCSDSTNVPHPYQMQRPKSASAIMSELYAILCELRQHQACSRRALTAETT